MMRAAELYGESLYDLAAEEKQEQDILTEMQDNRNVTAGKSEVCRTALRAEHPEGEALRAPRSGVPR